MSEPRVSQLVGEADLFRVSRTTPFGEFNDDVAYLTALQSLIEYGDRIIELSAQVRAMLDGGTGLG